MAVTNRVKKRALHAPGNFRTLWDPHEPKSRGPKPALSAEQIARAAIAVADAEGLGAASMQRIAREMKVTTMALYRYFSGKQELVDRMIDTAGGPPPRFAFGTGRWRQQLAEWTHGCASIYRSHPWFLQAATARRRVMGPNEVGWLDAALMALGGTGLTGAEQLHAFLLLIGHVRSNAEFRAGDVKGLSAERWARIMMELAAEHRDCYPALVAAIESDALFESSMDGLDFGLECILDGIEARVSRKHIKSETGRLNTKKLRSMSHGKDSRPTH